MRSDERIGLLRAAPTCMLLGQELVVSTWYLGECLGHVMFRKSWQTNEPQQVIPLTV